MVIATGSVIVQFVTNGFGDKYVSAQVTGAKIENFIVQVVLSLGSAIAVFASQHYGAKKYERVMEGCKKSVLMSWAWSVISPIIMILLGKLIIRLVAGNVDSAIVDNAYIYTLVNSGFIFILGPLVILKSILPAVGITKWTMVSGFTEIIGRAGTGLLVMTLTSLSAVGDASGFVIMCFSNPVAWVFGLLTVFIDFIVMRKRFKRLIDMRNVKEKEDASAVSETVG
jgi:Na+-driven multidrug efflux pump